MRNLNARVPDPNEFISNPGDKFHVEYTSKINDDGTIVLVESGKTDIQEYIQSFKDQTDMSYIIKQLALGDTSVINQRKPLYGDFTEAPKTLMEFQQRMIDGQRAFESLDPDVRNQYDHSLLKFMADIGSEKWLKAMKDYLPAKDDSIIKDEIVVNSEVVDNA